MEQLELLKIPERQNDFHLRKMPKRKTKDFKPSFCEIVKTKSEFYTQFSERYLK